MGLCAGSPPSLRTDQLMSFVLKNKTKQKHLPSLFRRKATLSGYNDFRLLLISFSVPTGLSKGSITTFCWTRGSKEKGMGSSPQCCAGACPELKPGWYEGLADGLWEWTTLGGKNPHIASSLIKILSRQNNPPQKQSINSWKNPSSKRLLIFEAFCGKQMLPWKLNIW